MAHWPIVSVDFIINVMFFFTVDYSVALYLTIAEDLVSLASMRNHTLSLSMIEFKPKHRSWTDPMSNLQIILSAVHA